MILNMPVGSGAIQATSPQNPREICDFLKRKYTESDVSASITTTTGADLTANYQSEPITSTNSWKKRHLDNQNYELSVSSFFPQHQSPSPSSQECHQQQSGNDMSAPSIATTESNVGTGTFNIIANSTAFINDLFSYDANLLVPVTCSESDLATSEPIFTTPSTICVNSTNEFSEDNAADNWQATDLLELDHRYNSGIQTEITQLNPTVSLKPHEEETINTLNHNSPTPSVQSQSQSQTINELFAPSTQTPPAPAQSDPTHPNISQTMDSEAEFENNNLSWLLNFKFDEFPHLNPDVSTVVCGVGKSLKSQHQNGFGSNSGGGGGFKNVTGSTLNHSLSNGSLGARERSKSPRNSNKTVKKFEELVMEVTSELDGSDMMVAENVVIEDSSLHRAPKKPPFTYTELIEYALEDKGELTVSGIYQWISDRFPYYKSNDDRWKNSVRHNLSINPHFRKGQKAPQGAGHLWTISSGDSAENVLAWEHKKQRLDLFFKMENMNRERLAAQHQQLKQQSANNHTSIEQQQQQHKHHGCQHDQSLYDEAAVAAAAIQQEMLQQQPKDILSHQTNALHQCNGTAAANAVTCRLDSPQRHRPHQPQVLPELPYHDLMTDEELRKTAGQILNGIHREVEVQSVNHPVINTYQDVLLDNEDYLNPVHKDIAVNESGLRHSCSTASITTSSHCSSATPYFVTEIDPMELGIQMSSHPHPLSHTTNNNHNHNHRQHLHHQHHHHHHHNGSDHHHHHHHNHQQQSVVVNDQTLALNGEETDVVLFNDDFNLNYFTYNPVTDIVA